MHGPTACPRCGARRAPSPLPACPDCLLALGQQVADLPLPDGLAAALPDYRILDCIGRGGMGLVFRARQLELDRLVALKVLPKGGDAELAARFRREARALAALQHPGIVAVHGFGEAAGHLWIAMELVDGVDLRRLTQERLTPVQALDLVQQVCAALQYAHQQGVVHRDIKPENILVDREGRARLTDFGLAKLAAPADALHTRGSLLMGTPQYMAPEQLERPADVDHRADLYALGVVLYELLCGQLPVGRFAPPSRQPGVDPRLDRVVARALERDRERRYQTAAELGADVGAVQSPARRPSPLPLLLRLAASLLLGVVLVLGGFLLWRQLTTSAVAGMPLVHFLPGYLGCKVELQQPLRQALAAEGLAPEVIQQLGYDLQAVLDQYVALEQRHARLELRPDDTLEVVVAPFAAEREALAQELDRHLATAFAPVPPRRFGGSLRPPLAAALAERLMPCGAGPLAFALAAADDPQRPWRSLREVPARCEPALERFWMRTWLPQPSCLDRAQQLVGLLQQHGLDGVELELQSLSAARHLFTVGFTLRGAGVAAATAAEQQLRRRLAAAPWCADPGWTKVEEADDGRCLQVTWTNLQLPAPPTQRLLASQLPPAGDDPTVAVRQLLATRFCIEQVQHPQWTPQQGIGYLAAGWQFLLPQASAMPLERAWDVLRACEQLGPHCAVWGCGLRRQPDGAWRLPGFWLGVPRQQ